VKNRFIIGLIFLGSLSTQLVLSQGFETPIITQQHRVTTQKNNSQGRSENTLLSLPFWDDFSQSRVYPDTLLWEDSYDVAISPTTAIDAISFNTAVFNGITASGAAHSSIEFQAGDTDILTSCRIDLSDYDASSNIYLSFFYEKKGNGEIPDDNDGLRVEFMNEDSVWISNILQSNGDDVEILGDEVVEIDSFFQVLIPITDPQFFSDKFRFRFVATGRQTGLFDTWLIDYVYLNEGRNASDTEYPDRTFTKPLSSTFKDYYSIPLDHFLSDPSSFLNNVGSQFVVLGLDNEVFNYKMNTNIMHITEDQDTAVSITQQLATANDNVEDFNGLNILYLHRDFKAENLLDVTDFPDTAIYAELRYELVGELGDSISLAHDGIDFRTNDTIRNTFILDDYYAYDDGTAERGAGVNNVESQLAYKFGLPEGVTDSISAVDIYFPKTVQITQFGKQVRLKVWSNVNGLPDTELFSQEILIQKIDTLNQFYRYEFSEVVAVTDSFYVGWEQMTQDRIFVGLDKNTDSHERIFFNITGAWEANNNDIIGSLMIRPVFGELPPIDTTVTSLSKQEFESTINIYPNPSTGILYIDGDYDDVQILSLNGRRVYTGVIKDNTRTEVNMYGLPSGMYIVRLQKDNVIINKKIILNQ